MYILPRIYIYSDIYILAACTPHAPAQLLLVFTPSAQTAQPWAQTHNRLSGCVPARRMRSLLSPGLRVGGVGAAADALGLLLAALQIRQRHAGHAGRAVVRGPRLGRLELEGTCASDRKRSPPRSRPAPILCQLQPHHAQCGFVPCCAVCSVRGVGRRVHVPAQPDRPMRRTLLIRSWTVRPTLCCSRRHVEAGDGPSSESGCASRSSTSGSSQSPSAGSSLGA